MGLISSLRPNTTLVSTAKLSCTKTIDYSSRIAVKSLNINREDRTLKRVGRCQWCSNSSS